MPSTAKGDSKRKSPTCESEELPSTIKKVKFQAQRKFAQGFGKASTSNRLFPNSNPPTGSTNTKNAEPIEMFPTNQPNGFNFLTFLCFQGIENSLPESMNYFKNINVSPSKPSLKTNVIFAKPLVDLKVSIKDDKPSPRQPADRPFVAFGVRKQADPKFIEQMKKQTVKTKKVTKVEPAVTKKKILKKVVLTSTNLKKSVFQKNKLNQSSMKTRSAGPAMLTKVINKRGSRAIKVQKIAIKPPGKDISGHRRRIFLRSTENTRKLKLKHKISEVSVVVNKLDKKIKIAVPNSKLIKTDDTNKNEQKKLKVENKNQTKKAKSVKKSSTSPDFSSDDDKPLVTNPVGKVGLRRPKQKLILRATTRSMQKFIRKRPGVLTPRKTRSMIARKIIKRKMLFQNKETTPETRKSPRNGSKTSPPSKPAVNEKAYPKQQSNHVNELEKSGKRPTRKTKEAATFFMKMLGPKLVEHNSELEDDSSFESFPELPNARRAEEHEKELEQKSRASKKRFRNITIKHSPRKTRSVSIKNRMQIANLRDKKLLLENRNKLREKIALRQRSEAAKNVTIDLKDTNVSETNTKSYETSEAKKTLEKMEKTDKLTTCKNEIKDVNEKDLPDIPDAITKSTKIILKSVNKSENVESKPESKQLKKTNLKSKVEKDMRNSDHKEKTTKEILLKKIREKFNENVESKTKSTEKSEGPAKADAPKNKFTFPTPLARITTRRMSKCAPKTISVQRSNSKSPQSTNQPCGIRTRRMTVAVGEVIPKDFPEVIDAPKKSVKGSTSKSKDFSDSDEEPLAVKVIKVSDDSASNDETTKCVKGQVSDLENEKELSSKTSKQRKPTLVESNGNMNQTLQNSEDNNVNIKNDDVANTQLKHPSKDNFNTNIKSYTECFYNFIGLDQSNNHRSSPEQNIPGNIDIKKMVKTGDKHIKLEEIKCTEKKLSLSKMSVKPLSKEDKEKVSKGKINDKTDPKPNPTKEAKELQAHKRPDSQKKITEFLDKVGVKITKINETVNTNKKPPSELSFTNVKVKQEPTNKRNDNRSSKHVNVEIPATPGKVAKELLSPFSTDDDEEFHGFQKNDARYSHFGTNAVSCNKNLETIAKKLQTDGLQAKSSFLSKDLFCNDIERHFGKAKVNMSNEQIEKWLSDADKELKRIETSQVDLTNSKLDEKPEFSTPSDEQKNLSPDRFFGHRRQIFTKAKVIEQSPSPQNKAAFSPENESSVYAFDEPEITPVGVPFRRKTTKGTSGTSISQQTSEDEESIKHMSTNSTPNNKTVIKDAVIVNSDKDMNASDVSKVDQQKISMSVVKKTDKSSSGVNGMKTLLGKVVEPKSGGTSSMYPPVAQNKNVTSGISIRREDSSGEDSKFSYKSPASPFSTTSASSASSASKFPLSSRRSTITTSSAGNRSKFSGTIRNIDRLPPVEPLVLTRFPSISDPATIVEAPTFHPHEKDFQDPLEYIERIRPHAEQFGICRIVPPSSFKPECKVSDDMRFTAYNQYVHKMLYRWGPSVREMQAIKKYLSTQNIALTQPPWIGGIELDLPKLYHTVQELGGLTEVIENKKWPTVSEMMCIPKCAQYRPQKLDDIYCKYLLPYDTLSPAERDKLLKEVDKDWEDMQARLAQEADENSKNDAQETNSSESDSEDADLAECIVRGRSMPLNQFYRVARNTMNMWFKTGEPSVNEVEEEFWKHVTDRKNHICVHTGSIDSGSYGYGFSCNKASPFARHPWNLKVLTNNSQSMLRSLGPIMGVTVPTIHVGMVFSACCWYRDPHELPWIEYLHTGANKIWYSVPDLYHSAFRRTLNHLVPNLCLKTPIWLPTDTAMVPPNLLVENNVSLCRTVQEPGQYIVIFPKAFTSSLCTGYTVSESVFFAPSSWLPNARSIFDHLRESNEPAMFSLERLLLSMSSDSRCNVEILRRILPDVIAIKAVELQQREQLKGLGLIEHERLPQTNNKKRRKADTDGEYLCELCKTNLYISLVSNQEDDECYCLQHAIELIRDKKVPTTDCKLMYIYTDDELATVVDQLNSLIDVKVQKKQK